MSKTPSLIRLPMLYGAITGVIALPLIVLLYKLGRHPFLIAVFFDYRVFAFAFSMTACLAAIRKANKEGVLHFWQGLVGAELFTLAFVAMAGSLLYLYMVMEPAFVSNFITLSLEQLKQLSADDIAQIGEENYRYSLNAMGGVDRSFMLQRFIIQSLIIGAFIGIIVSAALRRSPRHETSYDG